MIKILLKLFLFSFPLLANAGNAPSVADMFNNGIDSFVASMVLVYWAASLIGVFLAIGAVLKFIDVAHGKAQIRTPLIMMFASAALISSLGAMDVISNSMSMGANVANPGDVLLPAGTAGGCNAVYKGVLVFIQLIGFVAFVRGWLLINQYAQQAREGIIGRALTHIFGGVMAINIKMTVSIFYATFYSGLPMPFCQ